MMNNELRPAYQGATSINQAPNRPTGTPWVLHSVGTILLRVLHRALGCFSHRC